MEGMTDRQFIKILKMVLEILKRSKDLQDAIKAIETIIEEESLGK